MTFDFDAPLDRRHTDSNKWGRYADDVLPLWVADMDFAVPAAIVAALERRLRHPVFGYAAASEGLRERIVTHCLVRYGWRIAVEDIVLLPGVEPGFNLALKALAVPGEGVVVNTPVYRPILNAPGHGGLERLDVPLEPDGSGGYAFDPTACRTMIERAAVYLLCNPHNPVGKVFRRDELESIARDCLACGTWIVSDEIHGDLVFDGHVHVPIASLDDEVAQRTITLMAASKTFNIAGLKTAFAIVPNQEMRRQFEAARLGMVDSVNLFGLAATEAALEHGEAWRRALIAYLTANRNHLVEAVRTRLPALRMSTPEATFLAWLDCSATGLEDPYRHFLDRGRVALSAGSDFGAAHARWARLNFGCTRAVLDDGIARLEACLGA